MIASEHDREVFVRGFERGRKQGIELGRQQGIELGMQQGIEQGRQLGMKFTKSVLRLEQEGYEISEIAEKLQIGEDEVRMIIKYSKD